MLSHPDDKENSQLLVPRDKDPAMDIFEMSLNVLEIELFLLGRDCITQVPADCACHAFHR
jgi:hypothetical protein